MKVASWAESLIHPEVVQPLSNFPAVTWEIMCPSYSCREMHATRIAWVSWVLWCLEDTAVSLVYVTLKFPGLLQCELHVGSQKN